MSTPESVDDRIELEVVGKSGQISLGKSYAGKTLRLERRRDGTMLLTRPRLGPSALQSARFVNAVQEYCGRVARTDAPPPVGRGPVDAR